MSKEKQRREIKKGKKKIQRELKNYTNILGENCHAPVLDPARRSKPDPGTWTSFTIYIYIYIYIFEYYRNKCRIIISIKEGPPFC